MLEIADIRRKRGDTGRPLIATLTDASGPIDLSEALRVRLLWRFRDELREAECEIADQSVAPGEVLHRWEPGDLDTPGLYLLEFEVTWSDMTVTTVPEAGWFRLLVTSDLDDPWARLPSWAPSVEEIARMAPSYTVGRFDDDSGDEEEPGRVRGTFDDRTMPTLDEVRGLIVDACDEVAGAVGVPIPEAHAGLARRCTAMRVVALISASKLAADTEESRGEWFAAMDPYREALRELIALCRAPLALRLV